MKNLIKTVFTLLLSTTLIISCTVSKGQDGKLGEPGKDGQNGKKGADGNNNDSTIGISFQKNDKNPKEIVDGILVGKAEKSDLQQEPFITWYTSEYNEYKTNPEVISAIKKNIKGVKITIFMGTWCGDSKNQVPDFYKILEEVGFDQKNVTLITMARNKTTPEQFEKDLNITNVPTMLFYKNGKEINRIVESPIISLEQDMLDILSGKAYKHSYAQ